MQILVQKFGETSVQNEDNRNHVLKHIKDALVKEYKLIVVVSALGRKPDPYATDTLLDMVDFPANHNSKRELDLLMACGETISSIVLSNELQKNHIRSIALTGAQAGFITNEDFNKAKIKEVRPERLIKEFRSEERRVGKEEENQGERREITTIGRGGSDTT